MWDLIIFVVAVAVMAWAVHRDDTISLGIGTGAAFCVGYYAVELMKMIMELG